MSIPVCMVSLLVNVGRMNTTVNFVPEMKSQLRTFHSIPSLQQGKSHDNKILQDSPRLKSILKSWSEAKKHPTKFEELFNQPLVPDTKFPKTNVINLIFMLCCYEHLIFQHFDPVNLENGTSRNFVSESPSFLGEDLTKPHSITTPKSRAQRFLWLLYNYLETNLIKEEILNNPFKDPENPLSIPALVPIPDGMNFDIDTPQEVEYAKTMEKVRMNFLKTDGNPDLMENGNKSEKSKDDGGSEKPKKGGRAVRNSGKSAKAAGNNGNNNNNTNNNKKVGDSKNNTAKPKPDDIHKEIFKNNKARSKFQRHYNGNIMYSTHSILNDELIEEEDAKFDGDGKIVSREVGNRKKRYNGDFGEFATTCLKMFKAGKNYHEAHYLEQAKNGENEVKVELKLGEDGTTISGFSIDI
ncbi:hypothetical protein DASC09_028810 [Saccharomycopsis crataegensis]|uniref:Ino eighty subunit 1 n=1 Tax=Saccharomycopsis crataegensis TaxID=43959 RepID=A0AAV5QLP3_9ASCO|nr:hypothetical protein DASC09_028810 [Saccharomycopsis crataegensis]